jgi:membrane protein YdbS with pleckstrin-like domain
VTDVKWADKATNPRKRRARQVLTILGWLAAVVYLIGVAIIEPWVFVWALGAVLVLAVIVGICLFCEWVGSDD